MSLSSTEEVARKPGKEGEVDIAEPEAVEREDADEAVAADDQSGAVDTLAKSAKAKASRVSVSVRTLVVGVVIAALTAALGIMTWLYVDANAKRDEKARQAADNSHAEHIALDYAVDAAQIRVEDLGAWKNNLVKGTTPELKAKLSDAAKSMEQILVPLHWDSTATPLVAKVRSNANGIYVVDTFVAVETKTLQAPDGLRSTATYSITIDSKHDWQITEVGGISTVVGEK